MARKLIIGLDPEHEQGRDALELGAILAETLAATPVMVAALPFALNVMSAHKLEESLREDTEELFAAAADRLKALGPETRAVASRSPAEVLGELATAEDALVIAIGSTHRGPLGRVFPGSAGENLLRGAPCAVAIAPRGYAARDEHRFVRIGVAFDGSPEAWTALETAIGLAERLHARLSLVTVAEPVRVGYRDALAALGGAAIPIHEEEEKQGVLRLGLARVSDGVPVEGRLAIGEAGRQIAEAAETFDLLVIGSRGYGPLRRTLLGSASGRAIRSAPCPVLVLPRAAGVDPLGVRVPTSSASQDGGAAEPSP